MSETPSNEPSSAAEDVTESAGAHAAAPVTTTPASHASAPSKFAKWGTVAALVLAILAVAGAAYGYFYPNQSAAAAAKYTDQQRNDAKKKVCETFRIVEHAVRSRAPKLPPDAGPVGGLTMLTFRQFTYFGSGALLHDQLDQKPETPSDLAKPTREVATALEEFSIGVIAGANGLAQDQLRVEVEEKIKTVDDICKKESAPS